MTIAARSRVRALVVASWFPAVDDSTRGRFVADQVAALEKTGRVDPAVLSFETILLAGSRSYREGQLDAIRSISTAAVVGDPRLFAASAMHGADGVPVARIPIAGGWKGAVGDHAVRERDRAFRALERRGLRWDVVHAHTGVPDAAGAARFAVRTGAPLVITEHSSFLGTLLKDPLQAAAYQRAVAASARVIAVSETLGRELAAQMPGLAAKLVIIPNAVDTDAFRPIPLADRHPDELLYVGYRRDTKGIDILLQALALVRVDRPGATLRLIGRSVDSPTEEGWHRMAADLGIADAVSFDPPALRPEVADAMARASVLVHASPRETFGITTVEALASGTPVVAVDSGGVTETLAGDPGLGELVPAGDAQAFARAVLRTLDRRETFDPEYLRSSAVSRFRASAIAARLADLYEQLADEARPGPGGSAPGPALVPDDVPEPASRVLVVGLTTHRTARVLASVPAELLGRMDVLCAAGDDITQLPPGLGSVTAIDLDGPYRGLDVRVVPGGRSARLRAAAADPVGSVRRRVLRSRAERYRTATARVALEAGLRSRGNEPTAYPDVVAVDGLDFLVVSLVPDAVRRLVPGGVRWLADQHHVLLTGKGSR